MRQVRERPRPDIERPDQDPVPDPNASSIGHRLAAEAVITPERLLVESDALVQGARPKLLGKPAALPGQSRLEFDPVGDLGRHGDDHLPRLDLDPVGEDPNRLAVLFDPAHWGAKPQPLAQRSGETKCQRLRPAFKPVLLGATAGTARHSLALDFALRLIRVDAR